MKIDRLVAKNVLFHFQCEPLPSSDFASRPDINTMKTELIDCHKNKEERKWFFEIQLIQMKFPERIASRRKIRSQPRAWKSEINVRNGKQHSWRILSSAPHLGHENAENCCRQLRRWAAGGHESRPSYIGFEIEGCGGRERESGSAGRAHKSRRKRNPTKKGRGANWQLREKRFCAWSRKNRLKAEGKLRRDRATQQNDMIRVSTNPLFAVSRRWLRNRENWNSLSTQSFNQEAIFSPQRNSISDSNWKEKLLDAVITSKKFPGE